MHIRSALHADHRCAHTHHVQHAKFALRDHGCVHITPTTHSLQGYFLSDWGCGHTHHVGSARLLCEYWCAHTHNILRLQCLFTCLFVSPNTHVFCVCLLKCSNDKVMEFNGSAIEIDGGKGQNMGVGDFMLVACTKG